MNSTKSVDGKSGLPLRVLHVTGDMNRGGAESMIMNLYRDIDRTVLQFDFLTFTAQASAYETEIQSMGGRIIRATSRRRFGTLARMLAIRKAIAQEGPFAAVHSHILFASGYSLLAAKLAGVPIRIAHAHSTRDAGARGRLHVVYESVSRLLIAFSATDLVACSKDAGAFLFGMQPRKSITYLPNGINVRMFKEATEHARRHKRQSLGLTDGDFCIGAVSRLEPEKNHSFMLSIARALAGRKFPFRLLFIGDGSLRRALEQQVKAERLESQVILTGVRTDVPEILSCLDALIMPSLFEGLPVSLVEAQFAGIPCVISSSITREVDLGLGLVIFRDIDSPEEWATVLQSALPAKPKQEVRLAALQAHGYDSALQVPALYRLYQIAVS